MYLHLSSTLQAHLEQMTSQPGEEKKKTGCRTERTEAVAAMMMKQVVVVVVFFSKLRRDLSVLGVSPIGRRYLVVNQGPELSISTLSPSARTMETWRVQYI